PPSSSVPVTCDCFYPSLTGPTPVRGAVCVALTPRIASTGASISAMAHGLAKPTNVEDRLGDHDLVGSGSPCPRLLRVRTRQRRRTPMRPIFVQDLTESVTFVLRVCKDSTCDIHVRRTVRGRALRLSGTRC